MSKKLYVCDLDGTLAEDGKNLSADTVDMLNKAFASNSKELVISSARNYLSIKSRIQGISKDIKIICRNGSAIYNEQGKVIYISQIKRENVLEAINYSAEQALCPIVIGIKGNAEKLYCKEEYLNDVSIKHVKNVQVEYVENFEDIGLENVIGIYAFGNITKDYTLSGVLIRKDRDFLQITSTSATKGKALEYLKSTNNYDSITCFGNDENDYSMLDIADDPYFVYDNLQNKKDKYNNIPWDDAKSIIQVITKGGV